MPRLFQPLAILIAACIGPAFAAACGGGEPVPREKVPRIAAVVTAYYHNSHADVLVSRLLEGYALDGQGELTLSRIITCLGEGGDLVQAAGGRPAWRRIRTNKIKIARTKRIEADGSGTGAAKPEKLDMPVLNNKVLAPVIGLIE